MPLYKYTTKEGTLWRAHINYTDSNGVHKQICKRGFRTRHDAQQYEQILSATLHAPGGAQSLTDALYELLGITAPMPFKSIQEPVQMPQQRKTFQDVYTEYWTTTVDRGLTDGTRATKENMLQKHILPFFGDYAIADINTEIIKKWQHTMQNKTTCNATPFSATYLHSVQSQLNAIINYAIRKGYIANSPMVDLKNMGEKNAPPRDIWSTEQYATFSKYAKQRDTFVIFELCYWLGLRRGEALGIRPMDINNGTLHIAQSVDSKGRIGKTKTSSSERTLVIPATIKTELDDYIKQCYDIQPTDRIFASVTTTRLQRDLQWAIKLSGLPHICIHGMRHSCASNLIANGVKDSDVARWLGHASARTTLRTYTHILPETESAIASLIDNAIRS